MDYAKAARELREARTALLHEELRRCREHPAYFVARYCRTRDRAQMITNLLPFQPLSVHRIVYEDGWFNYLPEWMLPPTPRP